MQLVSPLYVSTNISAEAFSDVCCAMLEGCVWRITSCFLARESDAVVAHSSLGVATDAEALGHALIAVSKPLPCVCLWSCLQLHDCGF